MIGFSIAKDFLALTLSLLSLIFFFYGIIGPRQKDIAPSNLI
jgi:hypothetical protein